MKVEGQASLRAEDRGPSSFAIDRDVLEAAPRQEGAEVLRTAPGVYIGRAEGLAGAAAPGRTGRGLLFLRRGL